MKGYLTLTARGLADSWRSMIGWAVGIIAVVSLYLPLFPSFGGAEMEDLIASLPPELITALGYDNIASGAGYAQATVYTLIGFVLLTIASIGWGAAGIAGAEERGVLELTAAHAVSRPALVLARATEIVIRLAVLVTVAFLGTWALNGPSELGLEIGNLVAISFALLGLTALSGLSALAAGAVRGDDGLAVGVGAGIAVAGYVLNAIAGTNGDFAWVANFSPYSWAFQNDPLINGWDGGGLLLVYGLSAIVLTIGLLVFTRRDIGR